jgi:hypothetical protein
MLPNHKAIFEAEQQRLFDNRSKNERAPDAKEKQEMGQKGLYYSTIAKKFVPFGWRPSKNKPVKITTVRIKGA